MSSRTILKIPGWNWRKSKWKCILAILLMALFGILLATADLEYPENFQVVSSETHSLLFLEESNGEVFLVLDDGEQWDITCFNFSDQSAETPILKPIRRFEKIFLLNGEIGLGERVDGCVMLAIMGPNLDVEQAEQNGQTFFADLSDEDAYTFSVDSLLYTAPADGSALTIYGSMFDPDPPEETDIENVEFLESTPGGWIYAYSEGSLYRWRGRDYLLREQIDCPCPKKLVGENAFVDTDGVIHVINGNSTDPILDSMEGLDTEKSYGNDEALFVADISGNVHQYDWDGNEMGVSAIFGETLAITGSCALSESDGSFRVSTYQFVDPNDPPEATPSQTPPDDSTPPPEDSPDPTPSETPTSSPEPSDTPTPTFTPSPIPSSEPIPIITPEPGSTLITYAEREGYEGNYVLVSAGMHATDLRNLKSPQAINIYDFDGNPVFEGLLKTGMKMDDSTIVVLGDCNGDGDVTSADIYFVQRYILDVETFQTEASFMAADMQQDGKITTVDTVKIANEIARLGNEKVR